MLAFPRVVTARLARRATKCDAAASAIPASARKSTTRRRCGADHVAARDEGGRVGPSRPFHARMTSYGIWAS